MDYASKGVAGTGLGLGIVRASLLEEYKDVAKYNQMAVTA